MGKKALIHPTKKSYIYQRKKSKPNRLSISISFVFRLAVAAYHDTPTAILLSLVVMGQFRLLGARGQSLWQLHEIVPANLPAEYLVKGEARRATFPSSPCRLSPPLLTSSTSRGRCAGTAGKVVLGRVLDFFNTRHLLFLRRSEAASAEARSRLLNFAETAGMPESPIKA